MSIHKDNQVHGKGINLKEDSPAIGSKNQKPMSNLEFYIITAAIVASAAASVALAFAYIPPLSGLAIAIFFKNLGLVAGIVIGTGAVLATSAIIAAIRHFFFVDTPPDVKELSSSDAIHPSTSKNETSTIESDHTLPDVKELSSSDGEKIIENLCKSTLGDDFFANKQRFDQYDDLHLSANIPEDEHPGFISVSTPDPIAKFQRENPFDNPKSAHKGFFSTNEKNILGRRRLQAMAEGRLRHQ
ncbi:MAG: hypothetical protein LBI69_04385 [Puniceicoccales bacterium]|jgi:hypothetical protein|nr:hypothetical protein [Puniceicoccales bacterium]